MLRCVRNQSLICSIIILSLFAVPAVGQQLSLDSFSPADGTTDVDTNATFELVFNTALDTMVTFVEPGEFFLGLLFLPEDSLGEPESVMVSQDLRTVTVTGISLTPNTVFSIILLGARSLGGSSLDRPYVFTFTTGSTLPTGSVSGDVDFPGNNATGSLVALFENFFMEDPVAVGLALSPFQVNYVPDGDYTAIAIKDFNQDGSIDFGEGDALGVYDPNQDGIPDMVNVSGGGNTSGVNIDLTTPMLRTAQSSYNIANPLAQGIYADATLGAIFSSGTVVPEDGTSYMWFHDFIVESDTLLLSVMQFSDKAIAFVADTLDTLFDTPLPMGWIDSDVALDTAEANGGMEFRQMNEDAEVFASLFPAELDDGPDGLTAERGNSLNLGRHISRTKEKLRKSSTSNNQDPIWLIDYFSEELEDGIVIYINALTGEVIDFFTFTNTTAQMNLSQADQEAGMWSNDAQLVAVGNFGELGPNGFAPGWQYIYYSANKDSARIFYFFGGSYDGSESADQPLPSNDPLPPQWLDSSQIMPTAENNSNQFRQNYNSYFVTGFLGRGNLPGITDPIWCVEYVGFDVFPFDTLRVYIDGVTGDLINTTDVDENVVTAVPDEYALFQNYPNPFNPETVIKYDLPKSSEVRLVIYNPLGQVVRILVDKQQAAGSHTASWNGLNEQGLAAPNGIYFYKIETSEFTRSRKMTLLR